MAGKFHWLQELRNGSNRIGIRVILKYPVVLVGPVLSPVPRGQHEGIMQQAITLSNGVSMPLVGLGTYKTCGHEAVFSVVKAALQAGYRSFDTAAVYRNETELGEALRKFLPNFGLKREDVFITSKLNLFVMSCVTEDLE